jgi:hypothetical protein
MTSLAKWGTSREPSCVHAGLAPSPQGREMTSLGLALQPDEAASHLTRLYRLAWSLCGCPHVAEDLVQETYLRVLARPRQVRNPDSSP